MAALTFFLSRSQGLQILKEDGKPLCRFSTLPTPIQVDNSEQIVYLGQLSTDKQELIDALKSHPLFGKEIWEVPQLPVRGDIFSRVISGARASSTPTYISSMKDSDFSEMKEDLIKFGELKTIVINPLTGGKKARVPSSAVEEYNILARKLGYEEIN